MTNLVLSWIRCQKYNRNISQHTQNICQKWAYAIKEKLKNSDGGGYSACKVGNSIWCQNNHILSYRVKVYVDPAGLNLYK